MHSAEAQVPSSLAVCFIAVCFGTRWRPFPAQAWRCCPSPAHGSQRSCWAVGVWGVGTALRHPPWPICSGSSPTVYHGWTPRNVPCCTSLFLLGLSKVPELQGLSMHRQHILHSDLCACQHVLLNSVNPYQAHFAL